MRRLLASLASLGLAATIVLVDAPAEAGTRYHVTASVSAHDVAVGHTVVLRGKVGPRAVGKRVRVQRHTASGWTTVKRSKLNRHSRYRVSVTITHAGDNRLRVVKPRSPGHRKGISPVVVVSGWRWLWWKDLPVIEDWNTSMLASGMLAGRTYSPYLEQPWTTNGLGATAVRFDHRCSVLDTYVAGTSWSVDSYPSIVHVWGALDATPDSYDQDLARAQVSRDDLPATHFVVGGLTQYVGVRLTAVMFVNGDGVGWGATRLWCKL